MSNERTLIIDQENSGVPCINYSRADALEENALIQAQMHTYDGHVHWRQKSENKTVESLKGASEEDASAALFAALSTGIGERILDEGIQKYLAWQADNPRSKCLVVCSNIEEANRFQRRLRATGIAADIATSEDSSAAHQAIAEFKQSSEKNVLVTVGMAYEGLDVPAVDHLLLLTRIRSAPWLEQCIARATRFDKHGHPWEQQVAHIFCPDDRVLERVLEEMGMDQVIVIREPDEPPSGSGTITRSSDQVIPLSSEVTNRRSLDLDSRRELEVLALEESFAAEGIEATPDQIERLLKSSQQTHVLLELPITPAIERKALRKRIEMMVRECARFSNLEPKALNRAIKDEFGKSRADMTNEELDSVVAWLDRWREHHMF